MGEKYLGLTLSLVKTYANLLITYVTCYLPWQNSRHITSLAGILKQAEIFQLITSSNWFFLQQFKVVLPELFLGF